MTPDEYALAKCNNGLCLEGEREGEEVRSG